MNVETVTVNDNSSIKNVTLKFFAILSYKLSSDTDTCNQFTFG